MLRDCRDNEEYNNEIGKDIKRVSFHCVLLRNRSVSTIAVAAISESSGDEPCRRKVPSKKAAKRSSNDQDDIFFKERNCSHP